MARCNHDHGGQQKPDYWTVSAAAAELLTSLCSDAYWIAESIDFAFNLEGSILGLSPYAVGFGIGGAILSASGAAYSHYALNISGQSKYEHEHEHDHEPEADHDHEPEGDLETEPLPGDLAEARDPASHDADDPLIPKPPTQVYWWQKAALIGDFISHTGDVAGPLNFTYDLATNKESPFWAKMLVKCGATLFAANGSVANVRTCYESMKDINAKNAPEPEPVARLEAVVIR
jgi:hypothetical protein